MEKHQERLQNAFKMKETEVQYQAHVSDIGWQNIVTNGALAGTTGQNKGMEALKLQLSNARNGGIEYRAHVRDIGWQDYVSNGQQAGTTGQAKPVEAVSIRLTGKSRKNNMYLVIEYIQVFWWAWLGKDGEDAGHKVRKQSRRIEICLGKKWCSAPGSTEKAFLKNN